MVMVLTSWLRIVARVPLRIYDRIYSVVVWHSLRVITTILKAGPIPQHVAFIMDGNRRYARSRGIPLVQGHKAGFSAQRRVCRSLILFYRQISGIAQGP